MKVLVIDEDKFVRNVYESELHQQNVQVVLAENGMIGLKKAEEEKPDVIIMEMILTKINGFELLKKLKEHSDLKDIPIVVCSALGQQTDIDEAMKLGAEKYFSKEIFSLKQVIKEVLEILMSK